jgi:hypothetical protein
MSRKSLLGWVFILYDRHQKPGACVVNSQFIFLLEYLHKGVKESMQASNFSVLRQLR